MVLGLISKVQSRLTAGPSNAEQIAKVVPLSECPAECECSEKYPSSLKIDTLTSLNNSTSPYKLHCVIPTGKSDWSHNATDTSGSVEDAIAHWAKGNGQKLVGGAVKVSVSNIPVNEETGCSSGVNDVLLLPYFVWIKKVDAQDASKTFDKVIPMLIDIVNGNKPLPSVIAGHTIEPSLYKSYVFLCSHRTRDKRCGITAPILKREFDHNLRELGLLRDFGDDRPDGVEVAFINHVGGHKYAANVLIYLKTGETIWLARIAPPNVKPIVNETILGGGKVWPEKVRLVQKACAVSW